MAPLAELSPVPFTMPASMFVSSTGTTNLVDGDDPYLFQGLQVLKRHRRLVHAAGDLEDASQSGREPLGTKFCRLPFAFGLQDRRLFFTFGHRYRRLLLAFCFSDQQLAVVRSAPICRVIASRTAGGGLISLTSTLVTFTPQRSVTSSSFVRSTSFICSRLDRTSSRVMSPTTERKRGGGDVDAGTLEVLYGEDRCQRVEHLVEDDEVDGYGRIVLGDRRLVRDLQVLLSQVHPRDPVCHRVDEDQPGATCPAGTAQTEQDHPLVLAHDLDGNDRQNTAATSTMAITDQYEAVTAPPFLVLSSPEVSGPRTSPASDHTNRRSPSTFTTWTGAPAGSGPLRDCAVQVSLLTLAMPVGG